MRHTTHLLILPLLFGAAQSPVAAQGTLADYQRAAGLAKQYEGKALNIVDPVGWIEKTSRFWYRKSVKGGHEFILVDAETRSKAPAFDAQKLAAALWLATGQKYEPLHLPFSTIKFVENERAIEFTINDVTWRCTLDTYQCRKPERGEPDRPEWPEDSPFAWPVRPPFEINSAPPRKSPDGKREALVRNYNVAVRETGKSDLTFLSTDGSEGDYYDPHTLSWSPDSKKIAAYRVTAGFRRYVQYVESSPEDQLQPKHSTMQYTKPGDALDVQKPVLFELETRTARPIDSALFPNAYELSPLEWRKNSAALTFEYNQRGHQVYRVIEIDASTGKTRALISEEPKTFFCYSGKRFRDDIDDGREILWMSERDGWNHLYRYDGQTGAVKNQVTKGEWVVREVAHVDEEKRQIYFSAGGMEPGKDPYLVHYYRINFDGSGLTPLTPADADHSVSFSGDMKYYVDTYSRVDQAPLAELRRTSDSALVMPLERGDITDLIRAGWKPPELFVAKGRDGKTDIWGALFRPTNFDPARKYPVIEAIYAGPQGSYVPHGFVEFDGARSQAEIGFIVARIDGMGTSNRSKAFHDVAWKNLKDAGFPDRILWHKAVAAKYPWYDITRVGLYGGSAGGQNALGGLLFHPEFYHAAVAAAGCHDNRMDKIWWNEQWMGWPIGPQYAESSNVDNAYRLQGNLLLVVGELDKNVDPSSTMQVVHQLIQHNKEFDLLVVPGMGHGGGGDYGAHKRYDFFVRHLLHQEPPDWKALEDEGKKPEAAGTAAH
jgi:dipeptidyl aminopeptidase/acylaminoacyl peptidase